MDIGKINVEELQRKLAEANATWEAEETHLSLLTSQEQQNWLGLTPPTNAPSITEIEQKIPSILESIQTETLGAVNLPPVFDLRNINGKNFVTSIKNQKDCGSCVSFGTIATVEASLRMQHNDPNLQVDFSEAHLFFCHGQAEGRNCSTGWWPQSAYEALKTKGVVDESCYPYDEGLIKKDCSGLCTDSNNRLTKIKNYTELTGNPAKIKEWLSTKGPVSAAIIVYQDFLSYRKGVYKHVTGNQVGGHCISIVGYDDSQGCWICKNSWNNTWGEQGFFRIAYGECGIDHWCNHGVDTI